ncbi:MAG TPA: HIT domain-containing protein [Chloroflexi bacterium]|jgi:ATP adenylyltransferase|nr:HIT domain-containing protein [Chloroflexota bacterium]
MNYLWSPWRMKYILKHEPRSGCIFCKALECEDGPENLIVHRGERAFIILNRYPYTSGHAMVVPYAHQPSYEQLDPETRAEMMELVTRITGVLRALYQPEGFNMGANIGAAAGAGVAGHVHFHIVPRWAGDTNFMTSLSNTRVLPEGLEETYRRIAAAWLETEG